MVSLRAFLDHSAMTGLRAVNLGIDPVPTRSRPAAMRAICLKTSSRRTCSSRSPGGSWLGDLGLAPLEDLQYATVPEN